VALSAGMFNVDADAVATLACDLQDPPSTVVEFVERWRAGVSIVWGARRTREDSRPRVITSKLFNLLLRRYAMPEGSRFTTGSFFLIDRKVLDCFRQFPEHNRITFALVAWTGFDQEVVEYDRQRRMAGTSGWNFGRMFRTMYDAFVGFSTLPIRLMTIAGIGAFFLSMLLVVYLLVVVLAGSPLPGWTSQMLLLSSFFGVQFWLMAIAGEYLYRIYAEVVRRPLFFVSETTEARSR
jgi:dolichol-phosphate mannosyltransferase